jgi:hypothetical protein
MSCCGGRRKAHRAWLQARPIALRYLGSEPIHIVGNITGKPYSLTNTGQEIEVDPHDAPMLLRTQSFVVAQTQIQTSATP